MMPWDEKLFYIFYHLKYGVKNSKHFDTNEKNIHQFSPKHIPNPYPAARAPFLESFYQ